MSALRTLGVLARGYGVPGIAAGLSLVGLSLLLAPPTVVLPEVLTDLTVEARSVLLGALAACVVTLRACHEPAAAIARTSPDRWYPARVLRLVLVAAVGWLVLLAVEPAGAYVSGVWTLLLGEGLVGARLLGADLAWLLPSGHVVAASFLGVGAAGEPSWWAWVLAPDPGPVRVALGVTVLVVGLHTWAGGGDSRTGGGGAEDA